MRPRTACRLCRSRRRKCDRDDDIGRTVCSLCRKYNRVCTLAVTTDGQSGSSSSPSAIAPLESVSDAFPQHQTVTEYLPPTSLPSHANSTSIPTPDASNLAWAISNPASPNLLPSPALLSHCCNLYFDYVHDQLHTLFQKPAFMADLATDRVPPVILLAIVALSARFSSHAYFENISPRMRGIEYAKRAAQLLDPSDVCLRSVQACVLLGACRIVEGDAAGESIYYGMACRMAQLLDLPHRVCESRLERETNIRVWHTLIMIDEWSSSGINVPRQIAHPPEDVPLPMEEMAFLGLRRQDSIYATPTLSETSLLGQMIILNNLFKQVNQLNGKTAQDSDISSNLTQIEELVIRLDAWEASLPEYMQDSRSNLAHYAAQGLGRIYVAVYLGFYHYGQLLMYQFLHHDSSEDPKIRMFSQRCKGFAEKLCNMIYAALDTPGCDVLYNMVGHVVVIASTVQIHTLLFSGDSNEIAIARSRLERNYTILLRLRQLWPSLDYCMMRLQVFHRACVVSMETSFKLDNWMLKFLSEFAKPVNDRDTGSNMWAVGDIAVTPSSDFGLDSFAMLLAAPSSLEQV